MRLAFAPTTVAMMAALGMAGTAWSQQDCTGWNGSATIVLHARLSKSTTCTAPQQIDGLDCSAVQPTVDVAAPGIYALYMYLRNFDGARGVQAAFDWPAGWGFDPGNNRWNCRIGSLVGNEPLAPGPRDGTIAVAFDRITGGALSPIGVMQFDINGPGCLQILQSDFPDGTHIADDPMGVVEVYPIGSQNWGKVCLLTGGYNACDCRAMAVEDATWGRIKATYRR